MFSEEFGAVINAGKTKVRFLKKNPMGYFLASCLAGMFVGFGILLIFTIGGLLDGAPYTKVLMGVSFGIALSLVIMAGAELFTGNNFVLTAGIFAKEVTVKDTVILWIVCFLGNWVGSALLALVFYGTGLASGDVAAFIGATAAAKTNAAPLALFLRGVLCNTLVCLAVWCSFRAKSDSGKLIMVFWCLFAFITSGFEHSIANMTLLTVALFTSLGDQISFAGYFYNIGLVTLGNMAGAIVFLALPYYLISKKKEHETKLA